MCISLLGKVRAGFFLFTIVIHYFYQKTFALKSSGTVIAEQVQESAKPERTYLKACIFLLSVPLVSSHQHHLALGHWNLS